MDLSEELFDRENFHIYEQLLNSFSEEENYLFEKYRDRKEYIPGETIVFQNDPGDSVYFIDEGEVNIARMVDRDGKEHIPFVRVSAGGVFGEMSFLTGRCCSASVVANKPTAIYQINQEQFSEIKKINSDMACKIYQTVCEILINRLYKTDAKLTQFVKMFLE